MSAKNKKKPTTKKDLVYGLGTTGLSVARYLQRHDIEPVYYDSRDEPPGIDEIREMMPDAKVVLGKAPKTLLKNIARVIVSPGIPDSDDLLQQARKKKIVITSDIELFLKEAQAPVAAVTGSNGKSTVATLLAMMCDADGKKVLAGGNLGRPALDLLDEDDPDVFVLELSSFQLQRAPDLDAAVAGLLNISPDHLDWHSDEDEYRAAKYQVFSGAKAAVYNRDDAEVADHLDSKIPSLSFALDVPGEGQFGIREEDGVDFLARGEQLLLSVDDIELVGRHNQANALAALAMGQLMGLQLPAMLQVLDQFPGLPHRMQFVDEFNGARFINDSKATNVGAAIASVESIDGFVVLIAGGDGKGGDFDALARSIHRRLRCAVVIGQDGPKIKAALDGLAPVQSATDMNEAVRLAALQAHSGDTVLLAPACASFDMYSNYQRRGEDFCGAVGELRA